MARVRVARCWRTGRVAVAAGAVVFLGLGALAPIQAAAKPAGGWDPAWPHGEAVRASSGGAAQPLQVRVLSNRADLISADDALVEVVVPAGVNARDVVVDVDGRDVTRSFGVRPGGRYLGLVTGLPLGESVLTARTAQRGRASSISMTNHPNGGPAFAGKQVEPWICETEVAGFGKPLNDKCDVKPRYRFLYKSSNPALADLQPYDPEQPPLDVANATTDQGKTVPFVVREEVGVIDRGWYSVAVLYDPAKPWTLAAPQQAWNRKMLSTFHGGCGTSHYQQEPLDPLTGASATDNRSFNTARLGDGFLLITHSLFMAGSSCNDKVTAEALMMTKERVIEQYGEIRYVIGQGCSGGSFNQHVPANSYPGLLDGLIPSCSFGDVDSAGLYDATALLNYFTTKSPHLWNPAQIQTVYGRFWPVWAAARNFIPSYTDPSVCGRSVGPLGLGPATDSPEWGYNEQTNPDGTRCDYATYRGAVLGYHKPAPDGDGLARAVFCQTGVAYGLVPVLGGLILPEQFVDLNEKVGGIDRNGKFTEERYCEEDQVFINAYKAGTINDGSQLDLVPIVDIRGSGPVGNLEVHPPLWSWRLRDRLDKSNGHHHNQVFLTHNAGLVTPPNVEADAFRIMDAWLTRMEADTSDRPLPEKVLRNKPVNAVDTCYVGTQKIFDQAQCATLHPIEGDQFSAAGSPRAHDVLKCALRPLDRAEFATVGFTDSQWSRLQAVFPTGICDWTSPGVGQQPSIPWLTFKDGADDMRALGTPPRCTTCATESATAPGAPGPPAAPAPAPAPTNGQAALTGRSLPTTGGGTASAAALLAVAAAVALRRTPCAPIGRS